MLIKIFFISFLKIFDFFCFLSIFFRVHVWNFGFLIDFFDFFRFFNMEFYLAFYLLFYRLFFKKCVLAIFQALFKKKSKRAGKIGKMQFFFFFLYVTSIEIGKKCLKNHQNLTKKEPENRSKTYFLLPGHSLWLNSACGST